MLGCDGSQVTIVAGDGTYGYQEGTPGEFRHPQGIAVDGQGNVYVGDSENAAIREVDPSGNVTTLAGGSDAGFLDGPAATALFAYPVGVAVDARGTVYVADQANDRIRTVSAGTVATLAGNGQPGFADGTGGPNGTAEFQIPTQVAVDSVGNCYVADTGNGAIRVVDPSGDVSTLAMLPGGGGPNGVAVDSSGHVYATDGTQVFAIGAGGAVSVLAGSPNEGFEDGPAPSSLWSSALFGLAADGAGNVYVADVGDGRIRRIDPSGYVVVVAGGGDGGIDGSGGIDGTSSVLGVDVAPDSSGDLFTVDEGTNQVVKIQLGCAPSGIPQVCCGCTCTVLATLQARPSFIAVDAQNVYWSNFGSGANSFQDGAVYQMPKGGGPITALATGLDSAGPLALDAHAVYFTTFASDCGASGCPAQSGTVNQVPIGGGPVTQLAGGQPFPFNVAVDSQNVYWSNEGDQTTGTGDAGPSIWAIPIGGTGPATQLASGGLETSVGQGGGLAVQGGELYFEGQDAAGSNTVEAMSSAGGPTTTLAAGFDFTAGLELDQTNAYFWTRELFQDGGLPETIWSVPLDGSAQPTPLVQNTLGVPSAQDATNLYLFDFDEGLVLSVPKAGAAAPTTFCGGQINPQWVATDGTNLYWVLYGSPGDQGGMVVSAPLQ